MDFWSGKLNMGTATVTVEFNVTYDWPNPKWVTLDIPEQHVWDLECKLAKWSKDSFNIDIPVAKARFLGKKEHHDSMAVGSWIQGPYQFPLGVNRSYDNIEPVRPQNPDLFPDYLVEELLVTNTKDNLTLFATLTIPKGYQMKGCAILVSGSGKQDKEESMVGHKPFWIIADYLTKNGYAVMRFDDRGSFRSTGSFENSTIFDFANDVNAVIDMAKERTGITDDKKMGLIGHSEGSLVSQIVLKDRKLGFFISLAGPAVPVKELMMQQNKDLSTVMGVNENDFAKLVGPFLNKIFKIAGDLTVDSATAGSSIKNIFKIHGPKLPDAAKSRFSIGAEEDEVIAEFLRKPMRAFLSFNPSNYLDSIQTPFLALNGSLDKQVNAAQNLKAFKKYLANNPKNEVVEVKDKNHLFQTTTTGEISEYGKLEETFSPEVLILMRDWLNKVYQ